MALRMEFSWDVESLPKIGSEMTPGLGVQVVEDPGGTPRTAQIAITVGEHTHTDISTVDSNFTVFATAFKTALDADATLTGTYTVTWNGTTGYTIVNDQADVLELNFSAAATTEHGTNLRRLLGFSGDQTGAAGTTGYASDVRPYYLIIPASQGRTQYTRDREHSDIVDEELGDDDSSVMIAKISSRKIGDWQQAAEIETVPAVFSDAGTPTHADMVDDGTSANDVPWSWEDSFVHCRDAQHRISVLEGSDHEVWELRAEGAFFDPQRWTGTDLPIWMIPLRCRLIGRV